MWPAGDIAARRAGEAQGSELIEIGRRDTHATPTQKPPFPASIVKVEKKNVNAVKQFIIINNNHKTRAEGMVKLVTSKG
jgi:sporulation protein YlmC with PRC-barrel domain